MLLAATLSGCSSNPVGHSADAPASSGTPTSTSPSGPVSTSPAVRHFPPARVAFSVRRGAQDVAVDTVLKVAAAHGRLSSVAVRSAGDTGVVDGAITGDGRSWTASSLLEPATSYAVQAVVRGDNGHLVTRRSHFATQALTLDQQTYPSVTPLPGQTVGIGMPVIVHFDVPVTDKASIEKHMSVTTTPAQHGTWHWISDTEVHYRPQHYWKAGTKVEVHVDVNSVSAGNGIYGQENRDVDFAIGDAHIYKVNTANDQMQVFSNGKLLRTIPITTGQQPTYTTRSGTKVIIEKFASKDMNSETVGITGADAYNIKGVQWAMRVTYSGEFVHAAPWSVGYQGHSNVSHGCTGMSTDNADWLFHMSNVGDVVEYSGTNRQMELTNGYGDWNESYAVYRQGSAIH